MTAATLKEYTLKDLAQMAKKRGIQGWHSMRKNELIRALIRDEKQVLLKNSSEVRNRRAATTRRSDNAKNAKNANQRSVSVKNSSTGRDSEKAAAKRPSVVARKIQKARRQQEQLKDLSRILMNTYAQTKVCNGSAALESGKERIVLMVRDPYWLHAHWEISSRSIRRAQAAMAEYWHTAKPVIRLMEVPVKSTTFSTETFVRDIEIHGAVNNWYVDVCDPPKGYRVEIGYLASNHRFHSLARSNSILTPEPGVRDSVDHTWVDVAENCERIFALSGGYSSEGAADELQELLEERLRRPVGTSVVSRYGVGADPTLDKDRGFNLDVDAEMIIHGATKPGSHVTVGGEPLKLREDGTFTIRTALPDRRQVLPIISSSNDGTTQQTVVLAVERNTKVMEPVLRDSND